MGVELLLLWQEISSAPMIPSAPVKAPILFASSQAPW